jgi:cytochrome b involved in lipid metabolism
MKKQNKKQRKIKSIFLYLLAIALALLVYSFLYMKVNTTGKSIIEIKDSYSLSQIQKHNNAGDCWIVSNNIVYDITGLVDEINFKEQDCGKEVILNDYFTDLLNRNHQIGIIS